MNLLEAVVTKIISEPIYKYNKWFVDVEYECYGMNGVSSLMFDNEVDADNVKIGYKFLT